MCCIFSCLVCRSLLEKKMFVGVPVDRVQSSTVWAWLWRGFLKWCFARSPCRRDACGGVPLLWVTVVLCHAPLILTLAHYNPSPLVNELENPGVITCSVKMACPLGRVVDDCVEVVLLHPPRNWVVPLHWWCGG